jgi:hypothetical protein
MPVTPDEHIAFLTRLRAEAVQEFTAQPDDRRKAVLDLITSDLQIARLNQKRQRENRCKRRKPPARF